MRIAHTQFKVYAGLLLALACSSLQAADKSVKVIMPWDGEGTLYHIGTDKIMFMGAFEGVMYVEKEAGELDAAFANCPAVQHIDVGKKSTEASGYCSIVISAEDTVFAEWNCTGRVGACKGTFRLTGGTGAFKGVSGSSDLVIRSVLNTLVAGMGDGGVVRAASGIAILPKLTYKQPAAK